MHLSKIFNTLLLTVELIDIVFCGKAERKLLDKLRSQLFDFNVYERPVEAENSALEVQLGLTLQQIIDVDEKNQIIYTNMWITMRWSDYKLKWNPSEFGNITQLTIPQGLIWKPDILMYNSAADAFDSSYNSHVIVRSDGSVEQIPPGMFKSTCHINIRWFPFDDQECKLKFGSWTYDGTQIDLRFLDGIPQGSTDGFQLNGEWDLIEFPADRNVITYECCPQNPYIDLTFKIHIRRKKLYYLVNIIGPCMLFAFLGLFTFILPPDAGEKISFSVTVLLSLTVFMMIVSDTLPTTSESIPLIAIYFMGIMVMTAASVIATITALSYHHRTPETHKMSKLVKIGVCEWLAWLLRMQRPGHEPPIRRKKHWKEQQERKDLSSVNVKVSQSLLTNIKDLDQENHHCSHFTTSSPSLPILEVPMGQSLKLDAHPSLQPTLSAGHPLSKEVVSNLARYELRAILKELRYLSNKMRESEENDGVISDWKWCALVIDRLFIWVVAILNIVVAACIMFSAPNLFN